MIAYNHNHMDDDQVTVWHADPAQVQDLSASDRHFDTFGGPLDFDALIICDEDWRGQHPPIPSRLARLRAYYAAACDTERARKIGGAIGGLGLALAACAVGPWPGWVETVLYWTAIPCLLLGIVMLDPRD